MEVRPPHDVDHVLAAAEVIGSACPFCHTTTFITFPEDFDDPRAAKRIVIPRFVRLDPPQRTRPWTHMPTEGPDGRWSV